MSASPPWAWTPGRIEGVLASDCAAAIEEPMPLQTVAGSRERHGDGRDGRRGDRHHGDGAGERVGRDGDLPHTGQVRARRRDPLRPLRRARGGGPRRGHRGRNARRPSGSPCRRWCGSPTARNGRSSAPRRSASSVRASAGRSARPSPCTTATGRRRSTRISARLSVPSETVQQDVTLDIVHEEHVRAEVVAARPRRTDQERDRLLWR